MVGSTSPPETGMDDLRARVPEAGDPTTGTGTLDATYRLARRIVILVVGGTVLLFGLALTVLPGPAFVVIPIGLGILGLEFRWARRWLRQIKETAKQVTGLGADPAAAEREQEQEDGRAESGPRSP